MVQEARKPNQDLTGHKHAHGLLVDASKNTQICQILRIQDETRKNRIKNPKIHVQMKGREGKSKGITGEKQEGEGRRVAVATPRVAVRHAAVAWRRPTVASHRPAVASARVRAVGSGVGFVPEVGWSAFIPGHGHKDM